MEKVKITWNGQGGELDSVTVKGDPYKGVVTKALIKMLQEGSQIVTPGDYFIIEEVE